MCDASMGLSEFSCSRLVSKGCISMCRPAIIYIMGRRPLIRLWELDLLRLDPLRLRLSQSNPRKKMNVQAMRKEFAQANHISR